MLSQEPGTLSGSSTFVLSWIESSNGPVTGILAGSASIRRVPVLELSNPHCLVFMEELHSGYYYILNIKLLIKILCVR